MVTSAPAIDRRLQRVARRLTARGGRAADIHRAVGRYAVSLDLPRPSYEQVRLVVNAHRERLQRRRATIDLLVDIDLDVRPATDIVQRLPGMEDPPYRRR